MFDDNFSFATPRSPSLVSTNVSSTRDTSRSISPCSTSGPFPPPRFSVTDLAAQFSHHRLRQDSQICYDSCEAYANSDDDAAWSIPSIDQDECNTLSRSRTFPQRAQSPSRRAQRQLNTRLLCTSSHHRDIAVLVARMVDSEDQCCITPPEPSSPSNEVDEGYNSGDEPTPSSRRSSVATSRPRTNYRRSSDFKSTGACVSKDVRFRRERDQRRIRSSEKSS